MKQLIVAAVMMILIGVGGAAFRRYELRSADAEKAAQFLDRDRRLCRMYLGIDNPVIDIRQLMMACVHEVTADTPASGNQRSIIFKKAWQTCMPEMSTCDRALSRPISPE